jgi:hypothetical protein
MRALALQCMRAQAHRHHRRIPILDVIKGMVLNATGSPASFPIKHGHVFDFVDNTSVSHTSAYRPGLVTLDAAGSQLRA